MRICALVYDFPHEKSALGLIELARLGYEVVVVAAPKKTLNIKASSRYTPSNLQHWHPRDIARMFHFSYNVNEHESKYTAGLLSACDKGIVLGARVLPKHIVDVRPILNAHPGYLPDNRGLDNHKWAVLDDLPQAVTWHVVDEHIDRGTSLFRRKVPVFRSDALIDIYLRTLGVQIHSIGEALEADGELALGRGKYNKPLTPQEDMRLLKMLPQYLRRYDASRECSRSVLVD